MPSPESLDLHIRPPATVHLMGICGTGMAALAGMFKAAGYHVTGSDQACYPPMSNILQSMGIDVKLGYRAKNLNHRPALVVVGNVIRRVNPEAQALEKSGIPYMSMPDAIIHFFAEEKTRIVVVGTHGKTTVSAMIAWVLEYCGRDPSFMIGGVPRNFGTNHKLGNGACFIIEGDEYDTAYFDKTPKFLHYKPHMAVMTSCEFDHADIYKDYSAVEEQFIKFAKKLPNDGILVAAHEDRGVRQIVSHISGNVVTYGFNSDSDWSIAFYNVGAGAPAVAVARRGQCVGRANLPLMGRHNALNALSCIVLADHLGIHPDQALDALTKFKGIKRRQELLGEYGGILLIDDFAHHPTAVQETLEAVKRFYPKRRLVAIFEPRSNTSRRAVFQKDYANSFYFADLVILKEPDGVEDIPENERFSSIELAQNLTAAGKDAIAFQNVNEILKFLNDNLHSGDVVLIMSNGNFDNLNARLQRLLMEAINERGRAI